MLVIWGLGFGLVFRLLMVGLVLGRCMGLLGGLFVGVVGLLWVLCIRCSDFCILQLLCWFVCLLVFGICLLWVGYGLVGCVCVVLIDLFWFGLFDLFDGCCGWLLLLCVICLY